MNGLDRAAIVKIIVGTDLSESTHKPNDWIADPHFTIHRPQPFFHADMFRLSNNSDLVAEKL